MIGMLCYGSPSAICGGAVFFGYLILKAEAFFDIKLDVKLYCIIHQSAVVFSAEKKYNISTFSGERYARAGVCGEAAFSGRISGGSIC